MRKISKERQVTYYIGNGLSLIGIILFLSFFLQVAGFASGGLNSNPLNSLSNSGFSINLDGQDVMVIQNGGTPQFKMRMPQGPNMAQPVIGMLFIIVGQVVANIGKSGLAGSGVILDPEKAREDLQPFNVAKGQMINDTLGELDVVKDLALTLTKAVHPADQEDSEPRIMVRCRDCKNLNEEKANFCNHCGSKIS